MLTVNNGLIVIALIFYIHFWSMYRDNWNWASIVGTLVALVGAGMMISKPEHREKLGPCIVATGLVLGTIGFGLV